MKPLFLCTCEFDKAREARFREWRDKWLSILNATIMLEEIERESNTEIPNDPPPPKSISRPTIYE